MQAVDLYIQTRLLSDILAADLHDDVHDFLIENDVEAVEMKSDSEVAKGTDDVRHVGLGLTDSDCTALVLLCVTHADHVREDLRCGSVVCSLELRCGQLLLKRGDALRLLHDDGSAELFCVVLALNLDLLAAALTPSLE